MTSIFTADTSTQGIGGTTNTKSFNTKDNPNMRLFSKSGIYNSADNEIKFFTNNTDALTINNNQKVICDGSLITNLAWGNIDGKPTFFDGTWNSLSGKPTNFQADWLTTVINKPTLFDGTWNSLSGKPTNFQADWNSSIINRPDALVNISNIFPTSNVIQNSTTLINYNNLTNKPTNFQADWNSSIINRPDALVNISNIFITSNVLSNTSNSLFQSITSPVLTNYFSKFETSNIFTTSNHIQNSLNFINYNNLNNRPWINSGCNIYNLNNNVGIGTTNPISKLTINNNITDYSILNIEPTLWYKFDDANLGINSGSYGSIFNLNNTTGVLQNSNNYKFGSSSASFNGSSSYLEKSTSPTLNGKSFTISFWEKRTAINGEQKGIFSMGTVSALRNMIFIGYRPTNKMSFNFFNDDLEGSTIITSLNSWNFWTCTFNKDTLDHKIYLNGILDAGRKTNGAININTNRLWIGRFTNIYETNYYNGLIDDLRLYEVELNPNQVLDLYENTNSGFNLNVNSNTSNYQLKLYPYAINNSNGFSFKLVDNNINLNKDILSLYASANGSVGIGTKTPLTELDIIGSTYITSNVHIGNTPLRFINSFSNAILTSVAGTNESYLQFTSNGTLSLNEFTSADLLVVGAGGNGGIGSGGGGGGAGEVIYIPNFALRSGNLDITIGTSSINFADRASKISVSGNNIIQALGGGDGGYNLLYTSNNSITLTKNSFASFNYTDIINVNSGSYSITFNQGSITLTGINANKSYPILKDGSGNNINPNLWYIFDNSNLGLNSGSYGSTYDLTDNISVVYNTSDFAKGNGSASFNGSSSYLQKTTSPALNGKNFTVTFWEKRAGISTSQFGIFSIGSVSGQRQQVFIGYRPTNKMSFNFYDDDFESLTTITSTTTWNFWTFTYNTTSRIAKIYYNGVYESQRTIGGAINIDTNRLWIGRYTNIHGTAYYNGLVDDLRLYEIELTDAQILELYRGRVQIYNLPSTGGSGGGGAINQSGAINGVKFDEYKSLSLAGLNGSSSIGGNGGSGNTTYNTRYTTTITGSSLSVGLGGSGANSSSTPVIKTNYGDGGDGNNGLGFQGIIIIRFKEPFYTQIKTISNNGNSGLILNGNETTNKYQLRLFSWNDTFQLTGVPTRGYSFRTQDGNNSYDLLNFFSSFGGRIGVKTKNPLATFDVNGDIICKTFFVSGNEQYGILCQISNEHPVGEASIVLIGGQGTTYGSCSIVYSPDNNLGVINCSKSLQIKTSRVNSYIYINDTTGNIGIGITNPSSKLELIGDINSTSMTASTGNFNSISTYGLALNNGNISGVNRLTSVDVWTGPVKASSLDLNGGNITNCGTMQGTAQQARFLVANVNEWHYSQDNRNRFYYIDDLSVPTNSHTVFRTGSTSHYFQDKDGVDYAILDRFGYSGYFEVISGGAYDNIGAPDGSSSGVYVYRRMILRLSTFTEVHRCFIEDELYLNYDEFINEFIGRIVVTKGKIKTALKKEGEDWQILQGKEAITIDDSHPIIELSKIANDKKVLGVITKRNQNLDLPNRLVINSVGESAVWVVNINGNIENGDLITTSDYIGYGQKQMLKASEDADDIIRNYTLGKCMIDCEFELDNPNYKCQIIDEEKDLRKAFLPIFIYSG